MKAKESAKERTLRLLNAFEMHEAELFEKSGLYNLMKMLPGSEEMILRLRSAMVCFLRTELGNKKSTLSEPVKDDSYVVPNKYKHDLDSLRKDFREYMYRRINNGGL